MWRCHLSLALLLPLPRAIGTRDVHVCPGCAADTDVWTMKSWICQMLQEFGLKDLDKSGC